MGTSLGTKRGVDVGLILGTLDGLLLETFNGPISGIVERLLQGAIVESGLAINEVTSSGLVLVMSDGWS